MTVTVNDADIAVLLFGGTVPGPLTGLPVLPIDARTDLDWAIAAYRRLVVVGADADLATVLTRLLRTERLGVEVGYAPRRRSAATRIYRLPTGRRAARRVRRGAGRRVPLIRDETGTAIVGGAVWRGADGPLHGEAVVDDAVLFDGEVAGVRVEPTAAPPGVRAAVLTRRGRPRRWLTGRAVQLGSTGVLVTRDGVRAPRPTKRSTFYRHTQGWLLIR
ncbi:peptidase M50 [Mycobacterium sp. SM1]|uniref:peptidase M50 n=1 Tax=Mycobacterium sp. SM1 TaxID=2816243 RepID=UPI001BCFA277|nr:peptidase M50 [Mycobacterium sp. SM1]